MILLIDNYDSFVYNLARYFERLGQVTHVARNDALGIAEIQQHNPAAIVLSPGPGTPDNAGCSLEVVRQLHSTVPILGVCLGHQAIAMGLGGSIRRATEPVHGRTSRIQHDGLGLFQDTPNPLVVCRYHSLVVDPLTLPDLLQATSWTADGVLMSMAHRRFPVYGVQFHPESILSDAGYPLLGNFLRSAGLAASGGSEIPRELVEPDRHDEILPDTPVTF